jgi:hypothetical protein
MQHRLLDGAGNIQNWRHDHLSLPTVGHHLKGRLLLDHIAARLREAIRFCVVVSYGFFVATYLRVQILVMFSSMHNCRTTTLASHSHIKLVVTLEA